MAKYIRLTSEEYNKKLNVLKLVRDVSLNGNDTRVGLKFFNQSQFPTVEDLIVHDVENNIEKYFMYLLYYNHDELFTSDNPEFKVSKKMIEKIFNKYVIVIDEDDTEILNKITKDQRTNFSKKKKKEVLEPLSLYFDENEVEEFVDMISKFDFCNVKKKNTKKSIEDIFISYYS